MFFFLNYNNYDKDSDNNDDECDFDGTGRGVRVWYDSLEASGLWMRTGVKRSTRNMIYDFETGVPTRKPGNVVGRGEFIG